MPNSFTEKTAQRDGNNQLTSDSKKNLLNLLELVNTGKRPFSTITGVYKYRLKDIKTSINEITNPKMQEQLLQKFEFFQGKSKKCTKQNREKWKSIKNNLDLVNYRKIELNSLLYLIANSKKSIKCLDTYYKYSRSQVVMAINEIEDEQIKKELFEKWNKYIAERNEYNKKWKEKYKSLAPKQKIKKKKLKSSAACAASTTSLPFSLVSKAECENDGSISNIQSEVCKYFSNSDIDKISSIIMSDFELLSLANEKINEENSNTILQQSSINSSERQVMLKTVQVKPLTSCGRALDTGFSSVMFDDSYLPFTENLAGIPAADTVNNLLVPTNTIYEETKLASNFTFSHNQLTTQKITESPNIAETELLKLFDVEKGYNQEIFANDFSNFKGCNTVFQQLTTNSWETETFSKPLQAKQSPTNTEMNWDLFEASESIPQTLAVLTNVSFVETRIPSNVICTDKELNPQEINETSFNTVSTSKNASLSYFINEK